MSTFTILLGAISSATPRLDRQVEGTRVMPRRRHRPCRLLGLMPELWVGRFRFRGRWIYLWISPPCRARYFRRKGQDRRRLAIAAALDVARPAWCWPALSAASAPTMPSCI